MNTIPKRRLHPSRWTVLFASVFVVPFAVGLLYHEGVPKGEQGVAAEALADKLLTALNQPAWDSTPAIAWSFMYSHHYLWDKQHNIVEVSWKKYRVLLDLNTLDGKAWEAGQPVATDRTRRLLRKAWKYYANDSFWFIAPFKVRDPGTERRLVVYKGNPALLVTYTSGGVTPGDSYLWLLDATGMPTGWKMWVKVLPVGGVYVPWGDWVTLSTGAKVATSRKMGRVGIALTNIKAGTMQDFSKNFLEELKD